MRSMNIRREYAGWLPKLVVKAGLKQLPSVLQIPAGEFDTTTVLTRKPVSALFVAGGNDKHSHGALGNRAIGGSRSGSFAHCQIGVNVRLADAKIEKDGTRHNGDVLAAEDHPDAAPRQVPPDAGNAASNPKALPPASMMAWTESSRWPGSSAGVSSVPLADPRMSTPPTAPCSQRIL